MADFKSPSSKGSYVSKVTIKSLGMLTVSFFWYYRPASIRQSVNGLWLDTTGFKTPSDKNINKRWRKLGIYELIAKQCNKIALSSNYPSCIICTVGLKTQFSLINASYWQHSWKSTLLQSLTAVFCVQWQLSFSRSLSLFITVIWTGWDVEKVKDDSKPGSSLSSVCLIPTLHIANINLVFNLQSSMAAAIVCKKKNLD